MIDPLSFIVGAIIGAIGLAGICAIFSINGEDWGEQNEEDEFFDDLPPYLRKDYDPFSSRGPDRF